MAAQTIISPFSIFTDVDGNPLEDGYVYIGDDTLDPETNPKNVYWDEALTELVTQPIRTKGGYPLNSGIAGKIYTSGRYSITIKNKNSFQISTLASEMTSVTQAELALKRDISDSYSQTEINAALALKASLTGATFTGQVKGITPVSVEDLTRKDYVDARVPKTGIQNTENWNGEAYVDPLAIGTNPSALIFPDGTIIGTTDNGRYIRFTSGKVICKKNILNAFANVSTAAGAIFRSPASYIWTYPIAFVGELPQVTANDNASDATWIATSGNNLTTSSSRMYSWLSIATAENMAIAATGYWK